MRFTDRCISKAFGVSTNCLHSIFQALSLSAIRCSVACYLICYLSFGHGVCLQMHCPAFWLAFLGHCYLLTAKRELGLSRSSDLKLSHVHVYHRVVVYVAHFHARSLQLLAHELALLEAQPPLSSALVRVHPGLIDPAKHAQRMLNSLPCLVVRRDPRILC